MAVELGAYSILEFSQCTHTFQIRDNCSSVAKKKWLDNVASKVVLLKEHVTTKKQHRVKSEQLLSFYVKNLKSVLYSRCGNRASELSM